MVSPAHCLAVDQLDAMTPKTRPAQTWDDVHVDFADVLSAANPLQYLPVVGTIYRAVTGDDLHPAFRIAVSGVAAMLFGGPIGLAATMLGAVIDEVARSGPAAGAPPAVAVAHANGTLARAA